LNSKIVWCNKSFQERCWHLLHRFAN
jgi:hypothetical protein